VDTQKLRGQDRADGARIRIAVRMPAHVVIHRATVQARAAPDALQGLARQRVPQHACPAIVEQHQVEFPRPAISARGAGPGDEGGVARQLLAGGAARQQLQQHVQARQVGHDLVDSDHGHVQRRQGGAHAAVALVRDEHHRPDVCDEKVGAGDAHIGSHERVAQPCARDRGEPLRLGRRVHAQFCAEELRDALLGHVNRGRNDVGGCGARELDDELTEVGFERLDARSDQRMVQPDLLGGHALDLDRAANPVLPGNLHHDAVGLFAVARPVDVAACLGDAVFKQGEVHVEVVDGVQA